MQKLIINGELPDLNRIIEASKQHWAKYHQFKKQYTEFVALLAKTQLKPVMVYPVSISIDWHCKNERKDPDNIAHAKKYILDGLVEAGILKSDSFKCITEFQERFFVDRCNPRIEVTLSN